MIDDVTSSHEGVNVVLYDKSMSQPSVDESFVNTTRVYPFLPGKQ